MKFVIQFVVLFCLFVGQTLLSKPIELPWFKNNCFSNALVQSLYNLPLLTETLLSEGGSSSLEKKFSALVTEIAKAKERGEESLDKEKSEAFVKKGCSVMKRKYGEQQDAANLLTVLFTKFSEKIENLLYLKVATSVSCMVNGSNIIMLKKSAKEFPMKVFIRNYKSKDKSFHKSLGSSLDSTYMDEEVMTGDNKYKYKDYGGTTRSIDNCKRLVKLQWVPDYLVIQLIRFDTEIIKRGSRFYIGEKIDAAVEIPFDLDLVKYFHIDVKPDDTLYELICVIRHRGTLDSGHYTAYIKDQYEDKQRWYYCDDSRIWDIRDIEDGVKDFQKDINEKGYLLFYKHKKLAAKDGKLAAERIKKALERYEKRILAEKVTEKLFEDLAKSLSTLAAGG